MISSQQLELCKRFKVKLGPLISVLIKTESCVEEASKPSKAQTEKEAGRDHQRRGAGVRGAARDGRPTGPDPARPLEN